MTEFEIILRYLDAEDNLFSSAMVNGARPTRTQGLEKRMAVDAYVEAMTGKTFTIRKVL